MYCPVPPQVLQAASYMDVLPRPLEIPNITLEVTGSGNVQLVVRDGALVLTEVSDYTIQRYQLHLVFKQFTQRAYGTVRISEPDAQASSMPSVVGEF